MSWLLEVRRPDGGGAAMVLADHPCGRIRRLARTVRFTDGTWHCSPIVPGREKDTLRHALATRKKGASV